jgi:AcrR family transcriptional regulator
MARRIRTRLDPEVRREQILDAAEQVLVGRDPGEVTFEQIAEAAGVSRGLVHNYFGDRGGLLAAVYLRTSQRLDAELRNIVLSPPLLRSDDVHALVDVYLRFARANPGAWKLLTAVEPSAHPDVQRVRQARYARITSRWSGDAEGRLLARAIVGLLEAATLEWLETPEVELERAADVIHAQLWSGLAGLVGTPVGPT